MHRRILSFPNLVVHCEVAIVSPTLGADAMNAERLGRTLVKQRSASNSLYQLARWPGPLHAGQPEMLGRDVTARDIFLTLFMATHPPMMVSQGIDS